MFKRQQVPFNFRKENFLKLLNNPTRKASPINRFALFRDWGLKLFLICTGGLFRSFNKLFKQRAKAMNKKVE